MLQKMYTNSAFKPPGLRDNSVNFSISILWKFIPTTTDIDNSKFKK